MVATLMNSNFSALQSTSIKPKVANHDFSNVFKKVNNIKNTRDDQFAVQDVKTTDVEADPKAKEALKDSDLVKDVKETGSKHKENEIEEPKNQVTKEVAEKVTEEVTDEIEEVSEEMGKEVVTLKSIIEDPENAQVIEEAMLLISELFGIPMEALNELMEQLDMTAVDLADMGNLTQLVKEVFGHEDMGSLLLDQEATQVLKDVKVAVEKLAEELGIDISTLKEQIVAQRMANNNGKRVGQSTKEPVGHIPSEKAEQTQGVKVEVVDMRDAQSTTKYSQKNMNNQDQGSSTFSDLIGQNLTLTKEVVVQNTVNEIKYQQISTREVIDQIVTKAVVRLSTGKTSMHLQLNPGHLGKVAVSVTAEQGMVKGQFVAENHVVKEMLESNMIQLKAQLEEQGIKVDKIEVTVGDANQYFNQKNQSQEQHTSKKSSNRRIGGLRAITEVDEIDEVVNETQSVMQTSLDEHTVEYSA